MTASQRKRTSKSEQRYVVLSWKFFLKFALWATSSALFLYGISVFGGAAKFASQFLLAMMIAHGVELAHQALHRTGFGSSELDRVAGTFLCLPALVSFTLYQFTHFRHHRLNGRFDDQESFGYWFDLMKSPFLLVRCSGLLLHVWMASHFATAIIRVGASLTGHLKPMLINEGLPVVSASRTVLEYRLMGFLIGLALVLSLFFDFTVMVDFWLIPMALFAPIHALLELPEHFGCDHPCDDGRKNTRSIRAGWFMRWFTNGNCHHVGHHFDMRIPMDSRLAVFEDDLRAVADFKFDSISYWNFYGCVIRFIFTGKGL